MAERLGQGAGGLLADSRAIELLPRRVVRRVLEATFGDEFAAAALVQLAIRILRMLASPWVRSTRTWSPVLRLAGPPPAALSGEALRIEGVSEVPDWRPSPMVGRLMPFQQRIGRLHVDDLGPAGPADGSGAADHQDGAFVDAERGIVDAGVIILRAVEHHRAALERLGSGSLR